MIRVRVIVWLAVLILGISPLHIRAQGDTSDLILFSFDTDADGWQLNPGGAGRDLVYNPPDPPRHAVELQVNFSGASHWQEALVSVQPPPDLSGYLTYSIDVFINAEMASSDFRAHLYTQTGSGWNWNQSGDFRVPTGQWTTLSVDLSTLGDITYTRTVGIKIGTSVTPFAGSIFFDNAIFSGNIPTPPLVYDFENDLQGWHGSGLVVTAFNHTMLAPSGGNNGSLKLIGQFSGSGSHEDAWISTTMPNDFSDFSSYSYLELDVFSPSEAQGLSGLLYIQAGDGMVWQDTGDLPLTPGSWTTLQLHLPGLQYLNQIHNIGVKIGAILNEPLSAEFLIDNVRLTGFILPTFRISDASGFENSATSLKFTVTRTGALTITSTVYFATADGTAIAGSDYVATSGTLTFGPGISTRSIFVKLLGDGIVEGNETFFVNLSNPTNGDITDGPGRGTIRNSTVRLTKPANNTFTSDNTPSFSWARIGGDAQYQLQVANNANFANPAIDTTITTTSYTPTIRLSDAKYYWRVRASNAAGNWGGWCTRRIVTVDTTPPTQPVLVVPKNGASISDNTPLFRWRAVSGATKYILQIDDNANFSSPIINRTLTTTSYTQPSSLPDKLYYWHVQAQDKAGNVSMWSNRWSFMVNVAPIAPPTNTFMPPISPSLTATPTATFTATETWMPTATLTNVPTSTLIPTATLLPTDQPSSTPVPSETLIPSETSTETPSPSETPTETPSPSETPTEVPTETPTETPTPSETPMEVPPVSDITDEPAS